MPVLRNVCGLVKLWCIQLWCIHRLETDAGYAYGRKQASLLRERLRDLGASDLGPFDTMAAE
jgi:hypothetical protein